MTKGTPPGGVIDAIHHTRTPWEALRAAYRLGRRPSPPRRGRAVGPAQARGNLVGAECRRGRERGGRPGRGRCRRQRESRLVHRRQWESRLEQRSRRDYRCNGRGRNTKSATTPTRPQPLRRHRPPGRPDVLHAAVQAGVARRRQRRRHHARRHRRQGQLPDLPATGRRPGGRHPGHPRPRRHPAGDVLGPRRVQQGDQQALGVLRPQDGSDRRSRRQQGFELRQQRLRLPVLPRQVPADPARPALRAGRGRGHPVVAPRLRDRRLGQRLLQRDGQAGHRRHRRRRVPAELLHRLRALPLRRLHGRHPVRPDDGRVLLQEAGRQAGEVGRARRAAPGRQPGRRCAEAQGRHPVPGDLRRPGVQAERRHLHQGRLGRDVRFVGRRREGLPV